MKDFVIKVQTEDAEKALVAFFSNYKVNIGQFLNEMIRATGMPVDAEVKVQDGTVEVYQLSTDKGYVLGEVAEGAEPPVQLMQYSQLAVNKRYLVQENDRLILYWKRAEGTPDVRLGQFKTISDSVIAFNSDGVKGAMKQVENMEKADLKQIKRKQRLGKELSQADKDALALAEAKKMVVEEADEEPVAEVAETTETLNTNG